MNILNFCICISLAAAELHEQLHYFETLKKLDVKVRKKRSLDDHSSFTTDVSFSALGRNFNLVLTPGSPVLASDFAAKVVYRDGRSSPLYVNQNDFFTGHMIGDETVTVDAHREEDAWGMNIYEKNEIYTLEPSWRILPQSDNHSMIIYRHSDIKWENIFPELNKTNKRVKVCGAVHPEDDAEFLPSLDNQSEKIHLENEKNEHSRKKRSPWTLNTCHIIAVADYSFFMGPGGGFPHQTANYIVQTMQKVDKLFRQTTWSEEQQLKGLGFQIKEMRIHTEHTDKSQFHSNQKHYNMELKNTSWPDGELLKQFGQDKDLTNFCLAHLFTHRRFEGGVLGLAYIASPRKFSTGGICSQLGSTKIAYNTGFSSTMNTKGYNMLTQEAVLVTAHEFGHNWGSEHDAETNECAPSSFNNGRFLMYPYAVSGYDENNDEFSPCSKRYVTEVLLAKAGSCFKGYRANVPLCGNGIIDKDEQCDSGGPGISGIDPCCDSNCKFKGNATCSPVNSECCRNCQKAPRGMICRGASKEQCLESAVCSGFSFDCPVSKPVPDSPETPCMDSGVCKKGVCLSYCERHIVGSKPCRCTKSGEECLRCCQLPGKLCRSVNASDFLSDGRPCSYGYCEAGQCVKARANMIQRLFTFIEKLTPDTLVAFMKSNIVGTIIVFSLVIWVPASWTVSCIDKKREKKSRKFEERWVSSETLLNRSFQNNILANQLENYKVKEAGKRRTYPNIHGAAPKAWPMEGGKPKLPPLIIPPEPPYTKTYNFNHQPDEPDEDVLRETVM